MISKQEQLYASGQTEDAKTMSYQYL